MAVRLRLWLVVLPLLAVSVEGGSSLVDHFAPRSYEGSELFSRPSASHHLLPYAVAAAASALLCALASFAVTGGRAGRKRLPIWVFAALPACAFAVQEYVEWTVSHGHAPWTLATTPSFLLGIALQIPFGAAATLVARLLIRASIAVGARLRSMAGRSRRPVSLLVPRPRNDAVRRRTAVEARRLTRGPPPLTAA